MPLLQENLERGTKGALSGLSFGDPLDQTSFLFRLWNSFYLGGGRKPSMWRMSNEEKVFYHGEGLRIL